MSKLATRNVDGILERVEEARSFLECGVRLVEAHQEARTPPGEVVVCLRRSLELLRAAHNELDVAAPRIDGRRSIRLGKEDASC